MENLQMIDIFKHIIKAIFTKPLQILKSIYYRFSHQNQQLAEERLAICNK